MIKKNKETIDTLNQIIKAIQDKKGRNISTLNFDRISNSICSYFVICEADNSRLVNAIAEEVEEKVNENVKVKPLSIEGKDTANWVLLDYADIVVHVFQDSYRQLYSLEKLWADAEITLIS